MGRSRREDAAAANESLAEIILESAHGSCGHRTESGSCCRTRGKSNNGFTDHSRLFEMCEVSGLRDSYKDCVSVQPGHEMY